MNNPPYHIKSCFEFEPLQPHDDTVLERSLLREVQKFQNQDKLLNRVVYDYLDKSPYLTGQAPECEITPYYEPQSLDDTTLLFESRFESANLRRVIQLSEFEYDLVLKTDYNSKRNCQWYYFQVSNTRAGQTYIFNIINLEKPDSLYN